MSFLFALGHLAVRSGTVAPDSVNSSSQGKHPSTLLRMWCLSQVTNRRSPRQRLGNPGCTSKRPTHVEADLRPQVRHEVGLEDNRRMSAACAFSEQDGLSLALVRYIISAQPQRWVIAVSTRIIIQSPQGLLDSYYGRYFQTTNPAANQVGPSCNIGSVGRSCYLSRVRVPCAEYSNPYSVPLVPARALWFLGAYIPRCAL